MEKRTEQQNIQTIIDRLTLQHPSMSPARVEQIVEVEYLKLNGRPVRQYVANLVEHAAKNRLTHVEVTRAAA